MKPYVIITDSTTDLPYEIVEKYNLVVIPLLYHVYDKTYSNTFKNPELSTEAFYDMVVKGALPTTSQLTPQDYENVLIPILKEGKDCLILSFSSQLSGTYNSGRIAVDELREQFPNQTIEIIDTKAASLGEGLLVYLAALQKEKGASLTEVVRYVEDKKLHIAHWFTVNDISHLRRGGRISAVSSILAKTLNIKPIMHTSDEGKLIPRYKAIGRKRAIKALYEEMKKTALKIPQIVFIGHGNDKASAEILADMIKNDEDFQIEEIVINPIGPVIGAHAGQGVLALFFQATNR